MAGNSPPPRPVITGRSLFRALCEGDTKRIPLPGHDLTRARVEGAAHNSGATPTGAKHTLELPCFEACHTTEPASRRPSHRELRSTAERQGSALSREFKSRLPDMEHTEATVLQRRRELAAMTKPALIDRIIALEQTAGPATDRE